MQVLHSRKLLGGGLFFCPYHLIAKENTNDHQNTAFIQTHTPLDMSESSQASLGNRTIPCRVIQQTQSIMQQTETMKMREYLKTSIELCAKFGEFAKAPTICYREIQLTWTRQGPGRADTTNVIQASWTQAYSSGAFTIGRA